MNSALDGLSGLINRPSGHRMSDERIDLTQFEGKGISPLMVIPGTYTIAEDNNRIYEDKGYNYPEDDENRYGWIVGHIDSHYECDDPEYGIVQSERQEAMAKLFAMAPDLIAELKRMYKREDLLWKAFIMAGNHGYYMTICEECDDVHTLDDKCPFICEFCCEKDCECSPSEEE